MELKLLWFGTNNFVLLYYNFASISNYNNYEMLFKNLLDVSNDIADDHLN